MRSAAGWVARLAPPPLLIVLGAWTGLCVVAFNALWWGSALGMSASVLTSIALPAGVRRGAFALGWLLLVLVVVLGRPEGDWAIVADWHGYTVLLTGLFLMVHAVVTVPRRTAEPENLLPPN